MIRTNTPLRLVIFTATLALFVGVFFLAPSALAHEEDSIVKDDAGSLVGKSGPGPGGKNSGGGGGADDGDPGEADPDWFQNSSWTGAEMTKTTDRYVVSWNVVSATGSYGLYGQLVEWFLGHGIKYISFWR